MNRSDLVSKYNFLYKTIIPYDKRYHDTCFYCGEVQDVIDHYPALATTEKMYGLYYGDYLLIPSCRSCNSFLSDSYQNNIHDRIKYVKKLIFKKNNRIIINGFKWFPEEIEELEKGHLMDIVLKMKYKSTVMIDRLTYKPYDFYIKKEKEKILYAISEDVNKDYYYLIESLEEEKEDLQKLFRENLYLKV